MGVQSVMSTTLWQRGNLGNPKYRKNSEIKISPCLYVGEREGFVSVFIDFIRVDKQNSLNSTFFYSYCNTTHKYNIPFPLLQELIHRLMEDLSEYDRGT